jgi:mRNA-capping enzyme
VKRTTKYGGLCQTVGELYVGGYESPFSNMHLDEDTEQLDGKIVECRWNCEKKQWDLMRVRNDKAYPNSLKTAQGICESIRQPVTKEILLDVIYNPQAIALDCYRPANPCSHHVTTENTVD